MPEISRFFGKPNQYHKRDPPMSVFDALKEQVLALPLEEREALIDIICDSLSPAVRESIHRAWEQEAEETWAAVQRGEMETFPMREVHKNLRQLMP